VTNTHTVIEDSGRDREYISILLIISVVLLRKMGEIASVRSDAARTVCTMAGTSTPARDRGRAGVIAGPRGREARRSRRARGNDSLEKRAGEGSGDEQNRRRSGAAGG